LSFDLRIIVMKHAPATRAGALAALVTLAPLLAACGGSSGAEANAGPRVVASFYPLQYVAERVVGDHAEVENLTSPGVEPHDLELTVRQTAEIADADLAFYELGFQPAVDDAVAQNEPENVVETTETVPLEDGGEGGDPHFWLDPTKLGEVAAAFTEKMSEVDPEHADAFHSNLEDLQADLTKLDQDFEKGLASCTVHTVVVSHDAFGYLDRRYSLDFHAIAGLSPDAEPSPAHIYELQELIESDGITTVFSEALASPEMSETIADDLAITTGVLDPIEGLGDDASDEDYLSLMRGNLAALEEANDC